jgi:hypothetical protein
VKLIELSNKHAAVAFTLILAGAVAACGGDDNNGSSTGTGGGGGSGGTGGSGGVVVDASPDGSGGRDASEEPMGTGGATGSGGSDAEAGTGMGGNTVDAAGGSDADAAVDGSPDVTSVETNDATVSPVDDAADGGATDDGFVANDAGPTLDDSATTDGGGPVIFSFNAPDPGDHYGWRSDTTDHGTVAVIAEGAPESPNGSLEFTADFGDAGALNEVSVFYSYSPDDGTTAQGTAAYAAYTTLHMLVRFRTAPPPEVAALKPFIIGGSRADENPNFGVYFEPLGQPALFAGGTWVDAAITIGSTADGGTPSIPDIADLWKIGVTIDLTNDAGVPSAPVVIDIDDIYVSR